VEGGRQGDLQEKLNQGGISMNTIATSNLDKPTRRTLTWTSLLTQSYGLYRESFWKLFRIALLPALLAYLWRYGYRLALHEFAVRGWISFQSGGFALLIASGWFNGAFYWVVSSFFFAAVASNVLVTTDEEKPAISDAFTRARARLSAVTVAALLSWTIFWLGRATASFALWSVMDRLRMRLGYYGMTLIFSISFLLLAGLLSRLGLVIPVLMDKPGASLTEALKTSVRITEGWEPFFMMFLAKSAILGYGFYWLGDYALGWLWQHGSLNATTYPWAAQTLYISLAAALESPLFIAFSILYRESSMLEKEALSATTVE
jgi:hypothetical protein